jgi:AcrR family transcriptional regulator
MAANDTKSRICLAAMRLAGRDGLLTLTLEKVAEEAGLSKGGVIHHFPSKEALLAGVIAYFTDQVETHMTRLVAEDPLPVFRWARAMLRLETEAQEVLPPSEGAPPDTSPAPLALDAAAMDRMMLSVLAATVHHPELIKPVQAIGQRLRGRLTANPEEGLDQLLIWLVLDGLFLWRFVGLIENNDPLIQRILSTLKERIDALTTAHQNRTADPTPAKVTPSPKKKRTKS